MDASSLFAPPPDFLKLLAHELRWNLLTALSRSDHRVQELVELLGQPMNLVSYHLKQLRGQQLVSERRSSADGRDVYYSLDFEVLRACYHAAGAALHPALVADHDGPALDSSDDSALPPTRVLFLCTHNSARSQMAEGILRHMGGGRVAAFSAGNQPADVHPDAIDALAAINIDIGQQQCKRSSASSPISPSTISSPSATAPARPARPSQTTPSASTGASPTPRLSKAPWPARRLFGRPRSS